MLPTIRPRGERVVMNPFSPIFKQPAEIFKLKTHLSPSEYGNDTNNSNCKPNDEMTQESNTVQ